MLDSTSNLNAAVDRFLKALTDYQAATAKISQASLRLSTHNHALCKEVSIVVHAAAPMITEHRPAPALQAALR